MKSLSLNRPHALFMVGLPGSGKSFFATRFSKTFSAPYVDSRSLAKLAKTPQDAEKAALLMAREVAKTHQTFVYEGDTDSRTRRTELARWAKKAGYQPMFIWVQTDQRTAVDRTLKTYSMTASEYDDLARHFSPPHETEQPVVISGKHTYATQARSVLGRLSKTRTTTTPTTSSITPRRSAGPSNDRRSIVIR